MARIKLEQETTYTRGDTELVSPEQRPTDENYKKYAYLVKMFQEKRYDQGRIVKQDDFVVQGILFNSLMYASQCALLEMAEILGEETAQIEDWIRKTRHGINTKLWDNERKMYIDYDLAADRPIITNTVAQFIPLFAGPSLERTDLKKYQLVPPDRAELMVQKLLSPDFWPNSGGYPVCSVAAGDAAFEPERMWRGPVWINTNWLIIRGLQRHGYHQIARDLTEETLELVYKNATTFQLTTTSLKQLKKDALPEAVVERLQDLAHQEFASQDRLLEAVEARIGKDRMLQYAESIVEHTHNGLYEHYHPFTGEGGSAKSFSWTASLTLDLIATYDKEPD